MEQLLGQFLGLVVAHQIGPADRVHEEGITRQHAPWRLLVAVEEQVGHVLGGMAGREARLHSHPPEGKLVAVPDRLVLKAVIGATFRADIELGLSAEASHQFAGTAQEVSVDVGLEDMGDGEAKAPGGLEVDLHVWARVYDGAGVRRVVTQQVGALSDAVGENLFEA